MTKNMRSFAGKCFNQPMHTNVEGDRQFIVRTKIGQASLVGMTFAFVKDVCMSRSTAGYPASARTSDFESDHREM